MRQLHLSTAIVVGMGLLFARPALSQNRGLDPLRAVVDSVLFRNADDPVMLVTRRLGRAPSPGGNVSPTLLDSLATRRADIRRVESLECPPCHPPDGVGIAVWISAPYADREHGTVVDVIEYGLADSARGPVLAGAGNRYFLRQEDGRWVVWGFAPIFTT